VSYGSSHLKRGEVSLHETAWPVRNQRLVEETVESVAVNPSLSDNEFALPAIPAPDFDVEHGKSSTTVPFILGSRVRQKSRIRIHATSKPDAAPAGFELRPHLSRGPVPFLRSSLSTVNV
jgi:hypothetical protein